jgi:glycosyltransferase involved in cell wall biosynthesis
VTSKPSVGIIIPCYEQARFLRGAIESALGQSIRPEEIIVVDDGSTDHPEQVSGDFPQVKLIPQANGGPGSARNAGLRAAKSDRVIFLDADDRLLPHAIESGLRCFQKWPEAAFVYGGYRLVGRFRQTERFRSAARLDLIRGNWIGMIATVMFDRVKVVTAGGFDETLRMCEDWDLFLRLSRDHTFASHPEVVACYFRHRRNTTKDVATLREWLEQARTKERRRGLTLEEERAWHEGAAELAAIYPSWPRRIGRLALRILRRAIPTRSLGRLGPSGHGHRKGRVDRVKP